MRKFELNIKNADGSPYWSEGFETRKELNDWLNEEKTRPYWKSDFIVTEIDNRAELKKIEDAANAAAEIEKTKRQALKEKLKTLRAKKNKNAADAIEALDALIDWLGATND